ncbi:MAG: 23S rRNA (guanosine(2251)-2'-O)-methyltransferase RlmB, partial [Chryseobacterium culicis]
GKTQSLNVSVACGAILYEAVRQKMTVIPNP